MKKFFQEFKAFATKGNILDLAVAFMLTTAFGQITQSFVKDVIMPPIGLLLGKVDFANLYINLTSTKYPTLAAAKEAGAAVISYGAFINTVINFIIVALVLFLIVKAVNKAAAKKEAAPAAPTTKECPYCFTSIPIKATRCPNCTSPLGG